MNKVFNINLGGYPFTIDDNAYQHLSAYLKTIHKHFQASEGYEEITSDIETRIAELFQESLGNHPIVTLKMVNEAITIMGTPEEFGAEPLDNFKEKTSHRNGNTSGQQYKTGKRLMRDPEDQVIGGVCSGIAAYFGITDPLWVRLGFILFTISGGVGIPAYIILWSILKEAKTSSDRLAMRGDDINISNMAKIVEEEVGNLGDKISEMTENWDGTGKKKSFTERTDLKNGIRDGFRFLGKGIKAGIGVLSVVAKPIIFIVGFALIIALAGIWLASIIGFFVGFPLLQFILPQQPMLGGLFIVNLAVFVGIPLLSLILLASKLVFNSQFSVRWKGGLLAFYIINAISMFGIGSYVASQFSMGAESYQSSERFTVTDDVLTINYTKNPYKDSWIQLGPGGMLKVADDALVNETIHLNIEKAEDDEFVLIQETKSRGNGLREAKNLAKKIQHEVKYANNELAIQPYFLLNGGEKWRAQQVYLTLKVPEGKSIKFNNLSSSRGWMINYIDNNDDHHHLFWARDKGEVYKMGKIGLMGKGIHENEQKSDFDFTDKYKGFSKVHVDGKMKIEVNQGDTYSVKLTGKDQYLRKVDIDQFDDVLKVSTNLQRTKSPVRLQITTPTLVEVDLENTDDAQLNGFKEPIMSIRNDGRGDIKAFVDVADLTIKLNGRNELDIRGKGKKMTTYLSDRAKLDAERFTVDLADIRVRTRSNAALAVSDTLRQRVDDRSRVKVDGDPVVIEE
ncbi:MAG: DUF2807 domain-containing protein [Bacteroidota bacterium]